VGQLGLSGCHLVLLDDRTPNILLSAQETENGIEEQKPKAPRTADHPLGLSREVHVHSTAAQQHSSHPRSDPSLATSRH